VRKRLSSTGSTLSFAHFLALLGGDAADPKGTWRSRNTECKEMVFLMTHREEPVAGDSCECPQGCPLGRVETCAAHFSSPVETVLITRGS
jgi:hypothetical protein